MSSIECNVVNIVHNSIENKVLFIYSGTRFIPYVETDSNFGKLGGKHSQQLIGSSGRQSASTMTQIFMKWATKCGNPGQCPRAQFITSRPESGIKWRTEGNTDGARILEPKLWMNFAYFTSRLYKLHFFSHIMDPV